MAQVDDLAGERQGLPLPRLPISVQDGPASPHSALLTNRSQWSGWLPPGVPHVLVGGAHTLPQAAAQTRGRLLLSGNCLPVLGDKGHICAQSLGGEEPVSPTAPSLAFPAEPGC